MEDFFQFSVFDTTKKPFKIDKPIRLIELFSGIGSQAKALERLGVDFEHYRICEFDKYAVASYNAVHGTDFTTSDITQITAKDLGIVDTYKYLYMMTYSFPCQDLSLAGKQKGMAKGDDTRSGLLWEVERLLNECSELPQVLLMENVTQVHGTKNKEHFDKWIKFLESKGYSNYWKDLNAKNFGIPQNRNRTFMVSVLGNYTYEFPKEFPLELRLKDMLEDSVDEKFYISNANINKIINQHEQTTDAKCEQVGVLSGGKWDKMHDVSRRVYSEEGISPTIHTCGGGNTEPKVIGGIGEKKSNGGTQWYQQDRIYDNNVAISVTTGFNPYYKVEEPTIQKVDIPQVVRVRKYPIDTDKLVVVLRKHKNLSNQEIAEELNVPLTKVEHWFRKDEYFAIPDAEIWSALKALLKIETDEFDEAITVFEEKDGVFEKSNRCYFSDGIAPTLTSAKADEKIIEPNERFFKQALETVAENDCSVGDTVDAFNKRVNKSGVSPTITTRPEGFKTAILPVVEPLAYDEQNGYIRKDGIVGTLTTDGSSPKHNNRVVEPIRLGYIPYPNSNKAHQSNTFYDENAISPTLDTCTGGNRQVKIQQTNLRIRKLTPKECWKLMGFDDADFEKASQYNSNSQLYKQAGNSIVVDVLYYIFRQMI